MSVTSCHRLKKEQGGCLYSWKIYGILKYKAICLLLALSISSNKAFATDVEVCRLQPGLLYFVGAKQEERESLTELAVSANDIYGMRTAPRRISKEIFTI